MTKTGLRVGHRALSGTTFLPLKECCSFCWGGMLFLLLRRNVVSLVGMLFLWLNCCSLFQKYLISRTFMPPSHSQLRDIVKKGCRLITNRNDNVTTKWVELRDYFRFRFSWSVATFYYGPPPLPPPPATLCYNLVTFGHWFKLKILLSSRTA